MPKKNQTRKFEIQRANLNQFSNQFSSQNLPIINSRPTHQLIHPGKYRIFFCKIPYIFFSHRELLFILLELVN